MLAEEFEPGRSQDTKVEEGECSVSCTELTCLLGRTVHSRNCPLPHLDIVATRSKLIESSGNSSWHMVALHSVPQDHALGVLW